MAQRCNGLRRPGNGARSGCCHRLPVSFDIGWANRGAGGRAGTGAASSPGNVQLAPRASLALAGAWPLYRRCVVELPQADNVRMVGNLLGDPMQEVNIGVEVEAVFEHREDADPPYTLVQWRVV